VSLALTWPCRLCLLRVLLCMRLSTSFPLSKHTGGGDTAFAFFVLRVYLQLTWEVGLPLLLWSFPPTTTFTSFSAPDYWVVLLSLPAAMFVYSSHGRWVFPSSCGVFHPPPLSQIFLLLVLGACPRSHTLRPGLACLFTVPGRIPFPPLRHSVPPTLFPTCLHCSYCLLLSFSFFLRWRSVCPGGYADVAQGCLWEYHGTAKLALSVSS
jgi:hypothetical protein